MAGEIGVLVDGFTLADIQRMIAAIDDPDTSKPGVTTGNNAARADAIQSQKDTAKVGVMTGTYDPELASLFSGSLF